MSGGGGDAPARGATCGVSFRCRVPSSEGYTYLMHGTCQVGPNLGLDQDRNNLKGRIGRPVENLSRICRQKFVVRPILRQLFDEYPHFGPNVIFLSLCM